MGGRFEVRAVRARVEEPRDLQRIISSTPVGRSVKVSVVREGKVTAVDGSELTMKVDTICIHGDGPHAAEFGHRLRTGFEAAGIRVKAVGH